MLKKNKFRCIQHVIITLIKIFVDLHVWLICFSSRIFCLDEDECVIGNHQCSQICINTIGSYKCTCKNGFTLRSNGDCQGEISFTYKDFCITEKRNKNLEEIVGFLNQDSLTLRPLFQHSKNDIFLFNCYSLPGKKKIDTLSPMVVTT